MKKYSSVLFSFIVAVSFKVALLNFFQNVNFLSICHIIIVFSLFPRFFLGNIIHYNKTHNYENENIEGFPAKAKAMLRVLFDFYICLLEFTLFLGIADSKADLKKLLFFLLLLSGIDILWHVSLFSTSQSKSKETERASCSWLFINIFTCLYSGTLFTVSCQTNNNLINNQIMWYLITMVIYFGAAIADFFLNISLYLELKPETKETLLPEKKPSVSTVEAS